MFELGLGILFLGMVIGFGGFLFALKNMAGGMSDFNKGFGKYDFERGQSNFDSMFKGHLGAMGVMAFGGMVAFGGGIVAVAGFFH